MRMPMCRMLRYTTGRMGGLLPSASEMICRKSEIRIAQPTQELQRIKLPENNHRAANSIHSKQSIVLAGLTPPSSTLNSAQRIKSLATLLVATIPPWENPGGGGGGLRQEVPTKFQGVLKKQGAHRCQMLKVNPSLKGGGGLGRVGLQLER